MSEKLFQPLVTDNTPKSLIDLATDRTADLTDQLIILGGLNIGDHAFPDRIPDEDMATLNTHFAHQLGGPWDSIDSIVSDALGEVPDYALLPVVNNLIGIHRSDKFERAKQGEEHDELEWALGQIAGRSYVETSTDALSEVRRRYHLSFDRNKAIRHIKLDVLTFHRIVDIVDPDQPYDQLKRNDELLAQGSEMAGLIMDDDIVDSSFGNSTMFGDEKVRTRRQEALLLFAAKMHLTNTLQLDWALSPSSDLVREDPKSPNDFPDGFLNGRIMRAERFLRGLHASQIDDEMKPVRLVAAYHALGLIGVAQDYQLARMIAAEQTQ